MPTVTPTLIIGAGAAGLATAACLARRDLEYIVLEQAEVIAPAWRNHYDALHLHTDKGHSALPLLDFADDVPRYPSRDQLVAYLERYAAHFKIQPHFDRCVASARRQDEAWLVTTAAESYQAANLVVASGHTRVPRRPTWPGLSTFTGPVTHSSSYRNGASYAGQRVLVVGFGNSAGEIAIDLHQHGAQPAFSVRRPVNVIPKELLGINVLSIGILSSHLPPRLADALNAPILKLKYGDYGQYGLKKSKTGPLTQIAEEDRIPLIDTGTMDLIKAGHARVYPAIDHFQPAGAQFVDGQSAPFDALILATGYRPQVNAFLFDADDALDPAGAPNSSGTQAGPGLYFCGFYVSPTGMLREVGLEARRIAAAIAGG